MTLQDWSLVVFGATALLYFMVYLSIFQNPSVGKFLFLILAWIIHSATLVWYGIATGQVGFIMIVLLEIMMTTFVYIITGKVVKNENL